MNGKKILLGVVGFVVLVGSCNAVTGEDEPAPGPTAASAAAPQLTEPAPELEQVQATAPPRPDCVSTDTVYDAEGTCHPGGELVTVARVVDGDTVELDDGRIVRLLGVDAPEADTCAGPGATEFTRSLIGGDEVVMYREPGVDLDRYGRTLAYIARSGPYFVEDVGRDLVRAGWALPYDGDANPSYMGGLGRDADTAVYRPEGMFGPPCGEPLIHGDDDGNGVADWDEDADVDVPHANLPDGALTGGFCARKWYC